MRGLIFVAAAVALAGPAAAQAGDAAAPAPAPASAAAAVKVGATVRTADGRRVGRIDRLETRGGQQVASIIYQSRIIRIPVSTLSSAEGGLTTSLARADIK